MFIPEKYDIKINIKNEKAIFRFVGMIVAHCLLSFILFDMIDYIWNIPLYKFCRWFFVFLTAIPNVIYCIKEKITLWEDIKETKLSCVALGFLVGIAYGVVLFIITKITGLSLVSNAVFADGWKFFLYIVRMFFVTALVEEFSYRVAVYEGIVKLTNKKWLAPLFSGIIFGLAHIINGTWKQVIVVSIFGLILGYFRFFAKKSSFVALIVAHGTYNVFVTVAGRFL